MLKASTRISPTIPASGRYYFNDHYADGYRNLWRDYGQLDWPQGDGIQAWTTYWFSGEKKIQLSYRRQYNDPIFLGGGGLNDYLRRSIGWSSGIFRFSRWCSTSDLTSRW